MAGFNWNVTTKWDIKSYHRYYSLDIIFRTINWDMFNQLGLSRLDVLSPIDELIEGFSHENQPLLVDFPTASPWRVKNECPVGHPMCQLWLWEWRKQHTKKMCVCVQMCLRLVQCFRTWNFYVFVGNT